MYTFPLLKDKHYLAGLGIIGTSLFIYLIPEFASIRKDAMPGIFILSYLLTLTYFIYLTVLRKQLDMERRLAYRFQLLTLFMISAYALNRSIPIFEESVPWFSAAVIGSCASINALVAIENRPLWLDKALFALAGFSLALFTYMTFYTLPFYPLGLIGIILFGISLHIFIPLVLVVNILKYVTKTGPSLLKYVAAGFLLPVIFACLYTYKWQTLINEVNTNAINPVKELPDWVNVASKVKATGMLHKVLKTELIFGAVTGEFNFFPWDNLTTGGEPLKHDPLIHIASFFSPVMKISEEDRVKFLASMYGEGGLTETRLWSGGDLVTEEVHSEVKVWPACHLSYTENVITVRNTMPSVGWNQQQEAIYIFYLPEGGVVTSLSLWVEGVEEKAILTTRERADSAYATIVGREMRDPSIVHWQEGNKVSVRVFPVVNNSSRKFRIGVTAPLMKDGDELIYHHIRFDGPDRSEASSITNMHFAEPVEAKSASFASKSTTIYRNSGRFNPKWHIRMKAVKPSDCNFSFNGSSYSIKPYHKNLEPATIMSVYLDLNSSWSKEEFKDVINAARNLEIYAYHGLMTRITDENKDEIFKGSRRSIFSVFPFHTIKDPETSIVVTKSDGKSCSMKDLEKTSFYSSLQSFLGKGEKVRLFNLGQQLTPYLKTLKEYRVFRYDEGSPAILEGLIADSFFASDGESDNKIIVHAPQIEIEKSVGEKPSTGPDHVMRMFAYNQVMHKLGKGMMLNRPIDDEIVSIAREAYVVTPVSSLIVLETVKDYERFNIKDEGASLKNASINSKGAAPEPHEWVLIILGVISLAYLKFRRTLAFQKLRA